MYPPNLDEFFPQYDEATRDELLNTLPMNPVDFARVSDMYNLMFGVKTGSRRTKDAHIHPVIANSCLRQALLELLVSVANETEKNVGYLMRDRYVWEEVPVIFGEKMETNFPGVEIMNVTRGWDTVLNLDEVTVNYKTVDPITVEETVNQNYAQLPISEVPNPSNVYIRREDDGGAFQDVASYPITRVENAGDPYWRVALDTSALKYSSGDVLYCQDRQYAYADITPPTLAAGATLAPVYPGTNLMIPLARPVDVLSGGDHRYWFYSYTLVLPDLYYDPKIDLESGPPEFWKMNATIEFRAWSEVAAPMVVTVSQGNQEDEYTFDPTDEDASTINAFLVSSELGVYHFSIDPCFKFEYHCGYTPTSIRAKIYYKVSTHLLKEQYLRQITRIVQAMSYKVGAELPMVSCECIIETGFLAEQRQETGVVHRNLFTQVDKFEVAYSKRIGIDAYHAIISQMWTSRKLQPMI